MNIVSFLHVADAIEDMKNLEEMMDELGPPTGDSYVTATEDMHSIENENGKPMFPITNIQV